MCTCMHLFISLLHGQRLIELGEVSQVKTVVFFHQTTPSLRMLCHYANHTNTHCCQNTKKKYWKSFCFLLLNFSSFFLPSSTFPPQYRVMNSAIYLLHPPCYEVIFSYFPYLASSLLSPSISFITMFYFGSLFYISLFSNSLVFSPSPPRTHTPRLHTTSL